MSSYLTFYLVPKKKKTKYVKEDDDWKEVEVELPQEPLTLFYYTRSSDVYQEYYETLHPAYCGSEEKYTELTYNDSQLVVTEFKEDLDKAKKRLEIDYKMLKESGYSSELWDEIHSFEEYVEEKNITLQKLEHISDIVYDICEGYTDFEKVLINID